MSTSELRRRFFFRDHLHQSWYIKVDAESIDRVKCLAGVDLERIAFDAVELGAVISDIDRLIALISAITMPRTKPLSLDAKTVARASVALLKSLDDAFPAGVAKEALRIGNKYLRAIKRAGRRGA